MWDSTDYDRCVEQAELRKRVYEHCQGGFTDVCPDHQSAEVRNQLRIECADLADVPCRPAEPTPSDDSGECCYVVRVENEADTCK